jgi:hypothetical protein
MARLNEVAPNPSAFDPKLAGAIQRARAEYALVVEFSPVRALHMFDAAVASFESAGAMREGTIVRILSTVSTGMIGDRGAEQRMASLIEDLERGTLRYALHYARMEHGMLLVIAGEPRRAIEVLRPTIEPLRGSARLEFHARQNLMLALLQLEAWSDVEREGAAASELGVGRRLLSSVSAARALAALRLGDRAKALSLARNATELNTPADAYEVFEGLTESVAAEVLREHGDIDGARETIRTAVARLARIAADVPAERRALFWAMPFPNARVVTLARELGVEVPG